MIRLTLVLLATIGVVMLVAGRGPVAPPEGPDAFRAEVARARGVPTELVPRRSRLALDDEAGAVARALAASAVPDEDGPAAEVPPPGGAMSPPDGAATIRYVEGSRVNLRSGPGTTFDVVGKLGDGDRVELIEEPGNGWSKVRASATGEIGWMADFLLRAEG